MIADKEWYSEEERFAYAKKIMDGIRKNARTVTKVYGKENLPVDEKRDAVRAIRDINTLLKNGKSILVFPEGRYGDNRNNLLEFQTGVFSCNLKTGKPIVPVVIYDSWKAMNTNSYEKVETQVHFLKHIYCDEFN